MKTYLVTAQLGGSIYHGKFSTEREVRLGEYFHGCQALSELNWLWDSIGLKFSEVPELVVFVEEDNIVARFIP